MTSSARANREIFVGLAAYREPELALTIMSCVDNATRPDRLRFGVCQQWDDTIPDAGFDSLDALRERVPLRLVRFRHRESRGGCWARWVTQSLYDGEQYTLQVDAHSRFLPGWDTQLVEGLAALPGDRPLVTGTPPLYRRVDGVDIHVSAPDDRVPVTVVEQWSDEGWIHHPVAPTPSRSPRMARPTRVLSGGFVFTDGAWNVEVRQDPEHLYTGEEFALTLRSFTHGYDLWNPARHVVLHRSHPTTNPKYIHDDPDGAAARRHARACRRLRMLLSGDPDGILEPYSLGRVRTLEQYSAWSGLDVATRHISDDARVGVDPPWPSVAPARG